MSLNKAAGVSVCTPAAIFPSFSLHYLLLFRMVLRAGAGRLAGIGGATFLITLFTSLGADLCPSKAPTFFAFIISNCGSPVVLGAGESSAPF